MYDAVVVVTVWKRSTTRRILSMIANQTALVGQKAVVILFQNGEHVDITETKNECRDKSFWQGRDVDILHVHSKVESGYYGRFLSPLSVASSKEAFFILLDDDILFGNRYFENMLRVVRDGSLAQEMGDL